MARMAEMSSALGGLVPRPALAHDVGPHRAVGDLGSDVDGESAALQGVEVLGEALPLPLDAFGESGAGDVLDALHEADEPVVAVRTGRREADAAIAGDDGGHPVPRAGGEDLVPRRLAVVVGVDVDPSRGDQRAVGVDRALGTHPAQRAHGRDAPVVHRDISGARGCSRAVHDGAGSNDEVVHRATSLSGLHGGIGPRRLHKLHERGRTGARPSGPPPTGSRSAAPGPRASGPFPTRCGAARRRAPSGEAP